MPAKVTLTVKRGQLGQAEFVFDERATCIVGRSEECYPRVPKDEHHQTVSRHHCLLDINPPDVRVRDFGSLNGTYVNGVKIGQRAKGQSPEEAAAAAQFPEHDLGDGDELRIGKAVFRVGIHVPAACGRCAAEIPEHRLAASEVAPGAYLCDACHRDQQRAAAAAARQPAGAMEFAEDLRAPMPRTVPTLPTALPRDRGGGGGPRCSRCGRDVSGEVGAAGRGGGGGQYVCAECRADPLDLVRVLLERAKTGTRELAAIRGYAIERELGRGGMGAVYLARHEATGLRVALKVMLPQVAADPRRVDNFLRETENTRALDHPNVVRLMDAGCSEGTFFFTLEYCEGGSVDRLMAAKGGRLPARQAVSITLHALAGLEYAHRAEIPKVTLKDGSHGRGFGLVHRDLSPHNLFLARGDDGGGGGGAGWVVKVGDYGLAKAFDTAGLSGQTRTGSAAGKPLFMPRQQVINFKYARPEVDVWAAAACLYHMLTGQYPRDFRRDQDVWQTVLQTPAVPIRRRDPTIPAPLAGVIDAALVDDPEIGFKTAAELRQALEGVL